MREQVLREFFNGKVSATKLARDVAGSAKQVSQIASITSIEDMSKEFLVTSEMAVKLCDAVLRCEFPPEALKTIGFALLSSDKFFWDGNEDPITCLRSC